MFIYVKDTNQVQFELLKQLAGHSGQVTIVGDDDQTIYTCNKNKIVCVFYWNFRERC